MRVNELCDFLGASLKKEEDRELNQVIIAFKPLGYLWARKIGTAGLNKDGLTEFDSDLEELHKFLLSDVKKFRQKFVVPPSTAEWDDYEGQFQFIITRVTQYRAFGLLRISSAQQEYKSGYTGLFIVLEAEYQWDSSFGWNSNPISENRTL